MKKISSISQTKRFNLSFFSLLFTLSLSLLINQPAFANQHNKTQQIRIMPPQVILNNPKLQPIALTQLSIDSQILSNIATSTYELVFYNPNNRVLEGQLVFSLFDGQTVIDYALQINGKYRHASVVPKATAKQAFEETIRARIDPAIIEKTIGNNFKTRLYPIPAKGIKKIKITLQEVLDIRHNKLQYRIPFVTRQPLKRLHISVDLPNLNQNVSSNYARLTFDKATQGQRIQLEKTNIQIKKPILIEIDPNIEPSHFVQHQGRNQYLFATLQLPAAINNAAANQPRPTPKNIAIIWNNSLSNQTRNIKKELQFLQAYIQKAGKVQIQLVLLNNQAQRKNIGVICAQKQACVNGHDFTFLRNQLRRLPFDGTSNHAKVAINQLNVQEVLLFSNGIRTIHLADFGGVNNSHKPITAISSSIQSDPNLLHKYARRSKGHFIDLNTLSVQQALTQFLSQATYVQVVGASAGLNPADIFTTVQNKRLQVFAKSKRPLTQHDWIKLQVIQANQQHPLELKLAKLTPVKHQLDSLWASKKIQYLAMDYQKNKDNIIKLSKQYKVLSNDTSLIVLDRVQDYVRYGISPPSELRQQYSQLLKQKTNKKLYEKEQALVESIKLLQQQKAWYNKRFPKTKKVVIERKRKHRALAESDEVSAGAIPAPAPMAAPAPAPMPRRAPRRVAAKKPNSTDTNKAVAPKAEIKLKAFNPNAPYIKQIKAQPKAKWLETYYRLKTKHNKQAMFYVDVADLFSKNKMSQEAVVVLSNLLELDFENSEFLRVFAVKAMEFGQPHLAVKAYEKVKKLRPFEPQSFRDLALAYEKNKQYQKSLEVLYHVLIHTWDDRFDGIKIVIINEMNHLLARHKNLNKRNVDRRLINPMPVDLRIVINWSSDNTDIDLWVIDPYQEKTFYSNKVSHIGGKISNDITRGYGPEEFLIKEAVAGNYKIQANYYGNSQQKQLIPVTVRAEIYSNYAKVGEIQKEIVLRLKNQKAVIDIGEYRYAR